MPTTTNKSAGRRQSAALGNCGNDAVDRSKDTATTRRQQREKRRENLRHQAEVAPYLGLSDSEDDTANTEAQQETNEEAQQETSEEAKEEKNEETKDADLNESEQK